MVCADGAGLPVSQGLHCNSGSNDGNDRGFLANVVGAQLLHRCHDDQSQGNGRGQSAIFFIHIH